MASLANSMARMNQNLVQSLENQVEILQRLQQTLATIADSGEGPVAEAASGVSAATENVTQMNAALDELVDILGRTNTSTAQLEGSIARAFNRPEPRKFKTLQGELAKDAKKFIDQYRNSSKALLFFQGLAQGAENAVNVLKGAVSITTSLASSLFNVGFAIASIPFQMLGRLIDFAAKATGGTEFAQARENVRKYFGDLTKGSSVMVMDVGRNMQGFVKSTGLSLYSVFGNAAEMLAYANEQAQAMGASFQLIMKGFGKEQQGTLFAFMKGLGLTGEEARSIGLYAVAMGKNVKTVFQDMTKMALQLEKAYGENAKVLGRDVGKAMKDVTVFGNATVETLMKGATYARGLGVELDHIKGTLGAFGTFEQAADNVSLLTQAFGVNIDTMGMLQAGAAGDAAKQVDILRKSLFSAGVSADKMNNYNLKLLASSTGLSEEVARTVFSMNNQGRSLEDIQRQADLAKKKEEAYQETLRRLAPSIERVVRQFEMVGSFFEMFFKGMGRALVMFGPFKDVVYDIRTALMHTFQIGFQFGLKFFGILENTFGLFTSLHKFFKLGGVEKFFTMFSNVMETFTKTLSSGTGDVKGLLDNMTALIKDFFDPQKNPAMSGIAKSFEKIMTVIGSTIGAAIQTLTPMLVDAFKTITEILIDPGKMTKTQNEIEARFGFMGPFIMPIYLALKQNIPKIIDAFWPMVKELMYKLFSALADLEIPLPFGNSISLKWALFLKTFTPAIVKMIAGSMAQSRLGDIISQKLSDHIKKGTDEIVDKADSMGNDAGQKMSKGLFGGMSKGLKIGLGTTAALAGVAYTIYSAYKSSSDQAQAMIKSSEEQRSQGFKAMQQAQSEKDADEAHKEALANLRKRQAELKKGGGGPSGTDYLSGAGSMALVGAQVGSFIAPGIGTAIGAGVGALAGAASVYFGGQAAAKDAEAAAKRELENLENEEKALNKSLVEQKQKIKDDLKKAQDQAAIDALGKFTVDNAKERVEKIDALVKRVTGRDFEELKDKLLKVKSNLDGIATIVIIDPSKEEQFNKNMITMGNLYKFVGALVESIEAIKKANTDAISLMSKTEQLRGGIFHFTWAMTDMIAESYKQVGVITDVQLAGAAQMWTSIKGFFETSAGMVAAVQKVQPIEYEAAFSKLSTSIMAIKSLKDRPELAQTVTSEDLGFIRTASFNIEAVSGEMGGLERNMKMLFDHFTKIREYMGVDLDPAKVTTFLQKSVNYAAGTANVNFGAIPMINASVGKLSVVGANLDKIRTSAKILIEKSNELEGELKKLESNTFGIKANMDQIGLNLGFANKVALRNDKVVINLELSVDMRADKLERLLILRKDSIIRDRLDFFTEKYVSAKNPTMTNTGLASEADGVIKPLPVGPNSPIGVWSQDGLHDSSSIQ